MTSLGSGVSPQGFITVPGLKEGRQFSTSLLFFYRVEAVQVEKVDFVHVAMFVFDSGLALHGFQILSPLLTLTPYVSSILYKQLAFYFSLYTRESCRW